MGNVVGLLCKEKDLGGCSMFAADVRGSPVKWNQQFLQEQLGINDFSSMMVTCTEPIAALLYETPHFDGDLRVYHCTPDETLEVQQFGSAGSKYSSVVFTGDEYYLGGLEALSQPGVDLSEAVEPFRQGVKEELEADGDIDGIDLWRTRVWWTDWLNVMADSQFEGSDVYTGPTADHWRSIQMVGFYQRVDVDLDNWWFNYEVRMKWFLHPEIHNKVVWTRDPPLNDLELDDSLFFDPWAWTLWVEGGVWSDKLFNAISGKMWDSAEEINRKLVFGIIEKGGSFGESIVSNLEGLGWTIMKPRPCNAHSALPCGHTQSTPPTLILHHDPITKTSLKLQPAKHLRSPVPHKEGSGGLNMGKPVVLVDAEEDSVGINPVQHEQVIDGPDTVELPPVPLADVQGFAHMDEESSGQPVPFSSVAELERWVRSELELPPGHDVLLFEQTIGDKKGLLIVGGPKERMEEIKDVQARRMFSNAPLEETEEGA